jgi:hypothetical protein
MSGAQDVNSECKGTGALEKRRRRPPLSQLAPFLKQFRQFLLFRLLSMLVFSRTAVHNDPQTMSSEKLKPDRNIYRCTKLCSRDSGDEAEWSETQ